MLNTKTAALGHRMSTTVRAIIPLPWFDLADYPCLGLSTVYLFNTVTLTIPNALPMDFRSERKPATAAPVASQLPAAAGYGSFCSGNLCDDPHSRDHDVGLTRIVGAVAFRFTSGLGAFPRLAAQQTRAPDP